MSSAERSWSRRRWLRGTTSTAMAAGAGLLAACGGGGDEAMLIADRARYGVGDHATLRVRFSGGQARLEPGFGPVRSGDTVTTPPLDRAIVCRLIVRRPGQPDEVVVLPLEVDFRDRWVTLDEFFAVAFHAAVSDAAGGVLIAGGSRNQSTASADVRRFDPGSRRFVRVGALQSGRSGHSATLLADGRLLVVGGERALTSAPAWELFDPSLGRSVAGGPLHALRSMHTATRLADGRVLVVGGVGQSSAEVFDPATLTWRLLRSTLQHAREGHSASLLADGRVLLAGGHSRNTVYTFSELFDPATERFASLGGPNAERRLMHASVALPDGRVALIGGERSDGQTIEPLATTWRFDPVARAWGAGPELPRPRTLASAVAVPDGRVLVFGGQTDAAAASRDALAWTPHGVRSLAELPAARAWSTAHRLPDGRILVLGGTDADGQLHPHAMLYE
jgi:hypothetical protein